MLGQVEMAAPGTWLVSAYVPEADLGQLPVFYGQPIETTHRAIDGIPGDLVNDAGQQEASGHDPGPLDRSGVHQLVQHPQAAQRRWRI